MIDPTSYTAFNAYIVENRNSAKLFYFVKITDLDDDNYYYSDYNKHLGNYIPHKLLSVGSITARSSLRTGDFSLSPLSVTVKNTETPTAAASTYERISDLFASDELEGGLVNVYIGFDGIPLESDLVPFFTGRITNISHTGLSLSFNAVNQAFYELPDIPINDYTEVGYAGALKDLIGQPIPIIYGRHDFEATGNYYGIKSVVPAVVWRNNLLASAPDLELKISDNELDAINNLYIYNENLRALGEILDNRTDALADGETVLDLNDHDESAYLSARFYLYPDRYNTFVLDGAVNSGNAVDFDYDTYMELGTRSPIPLDDSQELFLAASSPLGDDFILGESSNSDGKKSSGINSVAVEVSGYAAGAVAAGTTLTIQIKNSNWEMSFDSTDINALSDVDSFNILSAGATASDGNLVIRYFRRWNGTDGAFVLDESGNTDVDVVPDLGYYQTMGEFAAHLEEKLNELSDAGSADNTYSVRYLPSRNKMKIVRLTGPNTFRIKPATSGFSPEVGFTTSVPSYDSDVAESDGFTILDIPDGNFSDIGIDIQYDRNDALEPRFYVKGARLNVDLRYTNFVPSNTSRLSSRSGTGGNNRTIPGGGRNGTRRTIITGNSRQRNNESGASLYWERQSQLDNLKKSSYFATVDGEPITTTYIKDPSDMIKDILTNHIGIASGRLNSTTFSAAKTAFSGRNCSALIAERINPLELFKDILKFYGAFFWENKEGKYNLTALKSSYSDSDVDLTLYYRDIRNISTDIKFFRSPVSDVNKDVKLYYLPDNVTGEMGRFVERATTSPLELQKSEYYCPYLSDDTSAENVAEFLAGDGAALGYYGEMKLGCEFTTYDPKFLYGEVGDIVSFSTEFDNYLSGFGVELGTIYFMIKDIRQDRNSVTCSVIEVDTSIDVIDPPN